MSSFQIDSALADRYHEVMAFRAEALQRYKANELSVVFGPPAKIVFPRVAAGSVPGARMRIGPLSISNYPPIWQFAENLIRKSSEPLNVLEIGPGNGALAQHLQATFGKRIVRYFGLERDPEITGPYERVDSIASLAVNIDVVIASEVAEHMTADELFRNILSPLAHRINPGGALCMSVPNPVAPGGIHRDFTHVQAYPWYDLYAILRLTFGDVAVHRTFYAWSFQRLAFVIPRIIICPMIEMDWCDGIVAIASRPRI